MTDARKQPDDEKPRRMSLYVGIVLLGVSLVIIAVATFLLINRMLG